jgi:hypothetical protein
MAMEAGEIERLIGKGSRMRASRSPTLPATATIMQRG